MANANLIVQRLHKIHQLILKEETGTSEQFAERLRISRRQLYYYLSELRNQGAPLLYDRLRHTYYYRIHFDMTVNRLYISTNAANQPFSNIAKIF